MFLPSYHLVNTSRLFVDQGRGGLLLRAGGELFGECESFILEIDTVLLYHNFLGLGFLFICGGNSFLTAQGKLLTAPPIFAFYLGR